ncbi:MAG: ABC transporter permease [Acidimicrobiaceae bacterium]|nr:ABC transporter permease [Acidimicrobiaceae bacterium]
MRPYLSQTRAEIRLAFAQPDLLALTIGIPALILVGFSLIKVLPLPAGVTSPPTFLVPGTLALAIMGTGMIGQSIGTAVDRNYGVLKRLGSTPLGRSGLMAAKITTILVVEVLQIALLLIVGLLLGWHQVGNFGSFLLLALLSTVAFSGLGLLMAGLIRYELMTGLTTILWFILMLISGMIFPLSKLPSWLQSFSRLLPPAATSQGFYHTLGVGGHVAASTWIALAVWAVIAPIAAAITFKWE